MDLQIEKTMLTKTRSHEISDILEGSYYNAKYRMPGSESGR